MSQPVVQPGVFEPDRIIVAPLSELVGIGELDGLHGLESVSWNFLSLDIETSREALKVEPQRATASLGVKNAVVRS